MTVGYVRSAWALPSRWAPNNRNQGSGRVSSLVDLIGPGIEVNLTRPAAPFAVSGESRSDYQCLLL